MASAEPWPGLRVSLDGLRPTEVVGANIYGDYFEILGVVPSEGRLLTAAETDSRADPSLVVISERLKGALFGGAGNVVGRRLVLGGYGVSLEATVVGVAGGGFRGHDRFMELDIFMPRSAMAALIADYPLERLYSRDGVPMSSFIVRPAAGVATRAAEAQLNQLASQLAGIYPDLQDLRAALTGGLLRPAYVTLLRASLLALLIGAALVILIPCANVANLLLMREVGRRREFTVRRAMGATTVRLVRLRLIEGALISVFGTAVGLGVALLVVNAMRGETILSMPGEPFLGMPLVDFDPDLRVIGFFVAALCLTPLLVGVAPPFLAGRRDSAGDLRGASAQITQGRRRLRLAFSATQVGLSLILLIGAALIGRSVRGLYSLDTGLDFAGVSTVTVDLSSVDASSRDPEYIEALQLELTNAMSAVPGVSQVAVTDFGPFHAMQGLAFLSAPGAGEDEGTQVAASWTGPGWFHVFGVEPIQGRVFNDDDARATSPLRAVLTASLAKQMFGGASAVGQTVRTGRSDFEYAEVVGVVEDLQARQLRSPNAETVFWGRPSAFHRRASPSMTVLFRTESSRAELMEDVHEAIQGAVPSLLVKAPAPLAERLDVQFSEQRVLTILFAVLSLITVVIAAVGLYAVIAFGVAEQTREFAIRRALGAERKRIIALVAQSSALIIGIGAVLGLCGGYALSRVLESRLFGVSPLDVASYGIGLSIVTAVAAIATWVPARVAARGDPVSALKYD